MVCNSSQRTDCGQDAAIDSDAVPGRLDAGMQRLEAHTPYLQEVAAAAACVGCLEGCNGVLGLLGVGTSSDELLLQSAVLQ